MSKNHLPLCTFTTFILFFVHDADTSAQPSKETSFECKEDGSSYRCNDGKTHSISKKTYQQNGKDLKIAIEASGKNTAIKADNITVSSANGADRDSEKSPWMCGVKVSEGGAVTLDNSVLKDVFVGANVHHGKLEMKIVSIDAAKIGVGVVSKQSSVALTNTKIKTGDGAISLLSQSGANLKMTGGSIDFTNGTGVQTGGEGKAILNNISITEKSSRTTNMGNGNKSAALHMLQGSGSLEMKNGKIDVDNAHGLLLEGIDNHATIKDSTIVVKGNPFYGMAFFWDATFKDSGQIVMPGKGKVNLEGTTITVPNGTAIYNKNFETSLKLSKDTKVSGDLLLVVKDNSSIKIEADASILKGKARVYDNSTAEIKLMNYSKWVLSKHKNETLEDLSVMDLSSLHITNSSIYFEAPRSNELYHYQILYIGKGSGVVYTAQGDARLYLNTYLNEGGDLVNQNTDRLLIHGDVSGQTTVYVQGVLGHSKGAVTGQGSSKGISLIQVSGKAEEDSFQLGGGYVSLGDSPYQYRLVAYGPNSTLGPANTDLYADQRLIQGSAPFWDFRLESKVVYPTSLPTPDLNSIPNSDPENHDHASTNNTFNTVTESDHHIITSEVSSIDPQIEKNPESSDLPRIPDEHEPEVTSLTPPVSSKPDEPDEFPAVSNPIPEDPSVTSAAPAMPEPNLPVAVPVKPSVVSTSKPISHFPQHVRVVVPQVPTYLLLPNSLFQVGLIDISNQSKQLEILRTIFSLSLKTDENPAFSLRGYSGNYHYDSNLSALEYGYAGDIDYNAVEAGILLQKSENKYSTTAFGIIGTYGKLSMQPQDVAQSQESTFDKWTVTAYGSMLHDTGFYVDGILSYGLSQGDVFTLARGKTATLKSRVLSSSLTVGEVFMTKCKGFAFDPQVQIIYQYLRFKEAHDIDHFDIDMGKLDQWMVRVGGRLTKTIAVIEKAPVVSFYSKFHFAHDFSKTGSVHFKDAFLLGSFGSSLEAGLGLNAQLSQNITLNSDFAYQYKLTKAGFSGAIFSVGLNYQF
ncbi:autotransporter outer membrane beta-barrel domain-containing protein [Bartonella sp. B17]